MTPTHLPAGHQALRAVSCPGKGSVGGWGLLTKLTWASLLMERPDTQQYGAAVPAISSLLDPGKVNLSGHGFPLCQMGMVPACVPGEALYQQIHV